MAPSVKYHCACLSSAAAPPPPHLASSSYSFHPLHALFFCEECDAVRCNRCVSIEVSGYYCPNCLFEVPSASVRAEKNRCARNCFLCPHCHNTLSVVPSDPPDAGDLRSSTIQIGSIGEPPFFLYCNNCRWDSAEVGITFEKPTGLALQLQKSEDTAPDSLEFERLKEHFEPFLRASSSHLPSAAHPVHTNPITAAASSALARDIPGVSKYNANLGRSRAGKDRTANKDEMPEYRSRVEISGMGGSGPGGEADSELMRHLETPAEIAKLEQRWIASWATPLPARELKPLRIPLHSKPTKRCPSCRHILIKPEQKAQSVRYKIKLVAANYLPAITVHLPFPQASKRPAAGSKVAAAADDEQAGGASGHGMNAGKTYPFHLSLTNPLYDPIHVRLNVQRHVAPPAATGTAAAAQEKARRPPFAVSLPTSAFPIAAFAEAWEYEDDEMFGEEEEGNVEGSGAEPTAGREHTSKGRTKTVGVLERKANVTVVGGEVVIGREGRGDVKFNMLVSYTYRSDDPAPSDDNDGDIGAKSTSTTAQKVLPDMKTFSFYTVVDLGVIIPKEDSRVEPEL